MRRGFAGDQSARRRPVRPGRVALPNSTERPSLRPGDWARSAAPASVPVGRPSIARRFNAGTKPGTTRVPKGRLRVGKTIAHTPPIQPSLRDSSPPAREPIFGCPFGTNGRRDSIPQIPCVETGSLPALDHPSPGLWVWPPTGSPRTWGGRVPHGSRACSTENTQSSFSVPP